MWLQPTTAKKQGKNRNHPDLVADDVDQTGREGFVVLADPEGNEFCILRR